MNPNCSGVRRGRENNFKGFCPLPETGVGASAGVGAEGQGGGVRNFRRMTHCLISTIRGNRCAAIDVVFDDLAIFLPDFIKNVMERQASEMPPC